MSPGRGGSDRAPGGPATGRTRRILVVDDSPSARRLLQDLLLHLGVALPDLRVTSNADEGLQLFTQWNPHVVFLDLELRPALGRPPASTTGESRNASGYDLAHQFLERDPNVKVVVCSASDPLDGPLQGLVRSGAVESMVKPVVAARVLELLEKIGAAPAPSRDRSERRRR